MNTTLSQKQQFWKEHIEHAQTENISLSAYAKQHDLSLTSLYAFKRTLLKKGALHPAEHAFTKLSVSPSSNVVNDPQILARFPNGVVLEIINVTPSLLSSLMAL